MRFKWFWWVVILGLCAVFVYGYRYNYLQPFDHQYARDLFDHSQWRMPITPRSIGDDLLYQVAGVDILKTGNLFDINSEMPPLGKYFYGLSILLFENAYILNLPLFGLALILYLLIAKEILHKPWQRFAALLLFLCQPLFFSQLNTTLLDLPQLVALFIHVFAVLKILKTKKAPLGYILLSGLGLGTFVSIKIGFLVAAILFLDAYLLIRAKKGWTLFPISVLIALVYLLVYLPYFFQGHSLVEFIKAQLWMLKFHTSSKITINHLLLPISFFSGWYKGWSENATWTRSEHWSLAWPLIGIFFLFQLARFVWKRSWKTPSSETYLFLLTSGILFIYFFIPFWTRYLLLVLPFMIILIIRYLPRFALVLPGILIFLSLIQLPLVLVTPAENTAAWIEKLWGEGLYQDFYSYLKFDQSNTPDRQRFWLDSLRFERQLTSSDREIEIKLSPHSRFENKIPAIINLRYQTALGPVKQTVPTELVRQQNRWFLAWRQELRFKGYRPNSRIQADLQEGQGGRLFTDDQRVLSSYEARPYFWVIPALIGNEESLQQQLTKLTGFDRPYLEILYKINAPVHLSAPIGYLKANLNTNVLRKTKLDPGIRVTLKNTRSYNLSEFKKKISQIQIFENAHPELNPQTGGQLLIINGQQMRVIKTRRMADGENVQLSEQESTILIP